MKSRLAGSFVLLVAAVAGGCPLLSGLSGGTQAAGSSTLAERLLAAGDMLDVQGASASGSTPVRTIDALTGCWGRSTGPETVAVPGADGVPTGLSVAARSVEVWRFENDGRYRRELVVRTGELPISLVTVEEGRVTLDENGVVCLHIERLGVRDLLGNLTLNPVSAQAAEHPMCWIAGIADDQLVLTEPSSDGQAREHESFVYTRVDCE